MTFCLRILIACITHNHALDVIMHLPFKVATEEVIIIAIQYIITDTLNSFVSIKKLQKTWGENFEQKL